MRTDRIAVGKYPSGPACRYGSNGGSDGYCLGGRHDREDDVHPSKIGPGASANAGGDPALTAGFTASIKNRQNIDASSDQAGGHGTSHGAQSQNRNADPIVNHNISHISARLEVR